MHRVADDSGYWENRDQDALIRQLDEMNRIVASFAGTFKDAADGAAGQVQSPISEYPNFEQLEAEGRAKNSQQPDDLS